MWTTLIWGSVIMAGVLLFLRITAKEIDRVGLSLASMERSLAKAEARVKAIEAPPASGNGKAA